MRKIWKRILFVTLLLFVLIMPDFFGMKKDVELVHALSRVEYYPVETIDEWLAFLRDEEVAERVRYEEEKGHLEANQEGTIETHPIRGTGKYPFLGVAKKTWGAWGEATLPYNYQWLKETGYVIIPTGLEIKEMGYSHYFYFQIQHEGHWIYIKIIGTEKDSNRDLSDEYYPRDQYARISSVTMKNGEPAVVALVEFETPSFWDSCTGNGEITRGVPLMRAYYGDIKIIAYCQSPMEMEEWIHFVEGLTFEKVLL